MQAQDGTAMKIVVDWDLCASHGQCEFAAPDVFQINDDGDLQVLDETPGPALRADVEQAIRRCPTRALRIDDDPLGDSEFNVLHSLRVRGFASPQQVAESSGVAVEEVTARLARLTDGGQVRARTGRISGFSLTPTGRIRHEVLRKDSLPATDLAVIEEAYQRFLAPNDALKQATTDWQLDRDGAGADVIDRIQAVNAVTADLLAPVCAVQPRFGAYVRRLSDALQRMQSGDVDALARPMSNSFHDVWMELHEDLLTVLGRKRTDADG
jgi:ferredoxin